MSGNCDVIVVFRISDQFGAVRGPDFWHRIWKNYVFSNSKPFALHKLKTELKNLQQSSHTIAFSKGAFLDQKRKFFAKKCWHQEN